MTDATQPQEQQPQPAQTLPDQPIQDPRLSRIADWAKLITAAAVLCTALGTGIGGLWMAAKNSKRADLGYQALVQKVNALAEKIAFLEGRMYGTRPEIHAPVRYGALIPYRKPDRSLYTLPVAVAGQPSSRPYVDSNTDKPRDKPKTVRKGLEILYRHKKPRTPALNARAYQQLPASLDSLLQHHDGAL